MTSRKPNYAFLLTTGALLFLFAHCLSSSYKPSSIQDVIKTRLSLLKGIRDNAVNRRGDGSALVAQGREYGGGYGGGGGMASYSSNYDTALTALAFLSFGVYLLNLLLMAMNRTTGRRKRDLDWDYVEGDVMSWQELAALFGESVSSYFGSSSPECGQKYLCVVKESLRSHSSVGEWFSTHKQLLGFLSRFNSLDLINDLSRDGECKTKTTNSNNCLFLRSLEDGLERAKKRDFNRLPDLLQSGKSRRIKRSSDDYDLSSFWGIIQFLQQILTPT